MLSMHIIDARVLISGRLDTVVRQLKNICLLSRELHLHSSFFFPTFHDLHFALDN